jgi:hypothetical protein
MLLVKKLITDLLVKQKNVYLAQASAMAVVFESMQTALGTWAMSPPGMAVGGW